MKRSARGITLAELMMAAGLVAVLYTVMAYITVQVSQASRKGAQAALVKMELLKTTEQLRWQLRGLYVPTEYSVKPAASPEASPGASPAAGAAARSARPGFIPGQLVLFGERTQTSESDVVIFLTNQPVGQRGATEVGYKLITVDGETALHYRQFNYRDPDGLHLPTDHNEAPWKPLNKSITTFWLEYSGDGATWQREWDGEEPPRRVRVNLSTRTGEKITFDASPGVSSQRW